MGSPIASPHDLTNHGRTMGGDFHPSTGITPPKQTPGYSTYKSPYGPKYNTQRNFHGWTLKHATRLYVANPISKAFQASSLIWSTHGDEAGCHRRIYTDEG